MNITMEELRKIKHGLPTGSVSRIATDLNISEQTVRNYFGANKLEKGEVVDRHVQPGPRGGFVHLEDDGILQAALKIIEENKAREN